MNRVYIVAAKRTPQGRFLGSLSGFTAVELGVHAAGAALEGIDVSLVDHVVVGNVLPPAINVARQIALQTGIPQSTPAYSVNMICASGLQAVSLAADAIRLGRSKLALCGGTESMSQAPHLQQRARTGVRLGDIRVTDSLLLGLSDPHIGETMTHTAERLSREFSISRSRQDEYACHSHEKATQAQREGYLTAEITPMGDLTVDEHPRADSSVEKLANLKPVLGTEGSVTAGNASGINDAAAMLVLCDQETLSIRGWKPMAELTFTATVGCDPRTMGLGPVYAIERLRAESGLELHDFDAIEINEAFAAQLLACIDDLKIAADDPRLNKNGGAIALGHPLGASGARLAVHLAHQAASGKIQCGLAALCVGGGMGISAVIQASK